MAEAEVEVLCRRCEQRKTGLSRTPLPGSWGPIVVAQTCEACWREWIEEQTRLINHEHILPSDPEQRKVLYQRMAGFLKLTPNQDTNPPR